MIFTEKGITERVTVKVIENGHGKPIMVLVLFMYRYWGSTGQTEILADTGTF